MVIFTSHAAVEAAVAEMAKAKLAIVLMAVAAPTVPVWKAAVDVAQNTNTSTVINTQKYH